MYFKLKIRRNRPFFEQHKFHIPLICKYNGSSPNKSFSVDYIIYNDFLQLHEKVIVH